MSRPAAAVPVAHPTTGVNQLNTIPTQIICPHCTLDALEREVVDLGYRCPRCGQELAHLDTTPAGMIRGVLGWLHRPGELILDRYGVVKVLGKGGFAAAYLVEDLRLNNKRRAIKELPQGLYDEAETGVLSQLSHPSIPDIIDRVHQDGMVYLVMEFGGSRTLESERQRWGGRLPYATLLPWLQQLGGVLSYLHHQSPPIIHRDLKPENVLLDEQGRVMLIDFGIAKQAEDGSQTRTLARAATHGFSPPEQALGTGTDPRSDVYALAATAYALLTGQVPPPAHQRVAGTELTEPQRLVSGLPEPFATALLQALNLNINLRPANIDEFMVQAGLTSAPPPTAKLDTSQTLLLGDLPPEQTGQVASVRMGSERIDLAPQSQARRRSGLGAGAGLTALLALAVGAGYWLAWQPDPAPAPPVEPRAAATATPAPVLPQAEPAPVQPPVPPVAASQAPATGTPPVTPVSVEAEPPKPAQPPAPGEPAPAAPPPVALQAEPVQPPAPPIREYQAPASGTPALPPVASQAEPIQPSPEAVKIAEPAEVANKPPTQERNSAASALDALNQAIAEPATRRPAPAPAAPTPAPPARAAAAPEPRKPAAAMARVEPPPATRAPASGRCLELQNRAALGEPISTSDLQKECKR